MSKNNTLQNIIESVLKEKKAPYDDSNVRSLRRGFYKLLEIMGSDIERLKAGRRNIEFDESEITFIKAIIKQLYDRQGLIAQFMDEQSEVTSLDVRNLVQLIIDEENNNGASDNELLCLAYFLENKFNCMLLFSIENCHAIIDAIVANMQEMPSSLQTIHMCKVEHILKKEFALRIVEMTLGIAAISQSIEQSKQDYEDNIGIQSYREYDPEIRTEYIRRDKSVLAKIKEDDGLRNYIENMIGKKAEEIFNYAILNDET